MKIEQPSFEPGPVTGIDFHLASVDIYEDDTGLVIRQMWAGVDRPEGYAMGLRYSDKALAERLRRAMLAGVACPGIGVRRDVLGKTYVATELNVIGRRLNADLKRLGF